jgi:uncharacterized SAM-binding protein YcdF (DUF218 family)
MTEIFDAAIVLGAALRPDGSPSPALCRRVGHGVRLALEGRVGGLLMTGGPTLHPTPEADIMRAMALAAGLAPERVVAETCSLNTIQNALHSAPIAAERGWRRLVLVTDAYHLPRARYIFARLGVRAAGSAAPPPDHPSREWYVAWVREAAAIPWTMLRVETRLLLRRGAG